MKDAYKYVIDFLLEVYASAERQDIDQKAFEFLSREPDFFYRILFYVIYKSIYKHLLISSNENRSLNDDDKAEIKTVWKKLFINKVSNYIHLIRSLKANKENLRTQKITATDNKRHLIFNDIYSKSITINFGSIPEVSSKTLIKPRDVLNLQIEDEYDVIVTDPPYGFNTQEDIEELFKIYTQGIKKLIVALRDPGQLILSLPEHSYNGQHLYSFTQKDFLIQQIISTVQQCGKEIVNPASSLTYDRQLFRPPYYWESKRSLRRSIVHFRIRNIEKHQDKN